MYTWIHNDYYYYYIYECIYVLVRASSDQEDGDIAVAGLVAVLPLGIGELGRVSLHDDVFHVRVSLEAGRHGICVNDTVQQDAGCWDEGQTSDY